MNHEFGNRNPKKEDEKRRCSITSGLLLKKALKCHYDENRIFSTKAIFKHKQVACMRGKMPFTIFKYLFLFQRY